MVCKDLSTHIQEVFVSLIIKQETYGFSCQPSPDSTSAMPDSQRKLHSPRPRGVEKVDNLDSPTLFIRQVGTEPLLSLVNIIWDEFIIWMINHSREPGMALYQPRFSDKT
jgi:hypothetical protein